MRHKVYESVVEAVCVGRLAEPFSNGDFKAACPGFGKGTYKAFLHKHRLGNPGEESELFELLSPGQFVCLRPFKYGLGAGKNESPTRDKIKRLIRNTWSEDEARAYASFTSTKADIERLRTIGLEVLQMIPNTSDSVGACALMSAPYAAIARDRTGWPVHQVAGDLLVDGYRIFGNDDEDVASAFDGSNPDWDGHSWIVVGDYVSDISIFRTAYSSAAPRRLREAIVERFGEGRGLLIVTPEQLATYGLEFVPKYVLSNDQVNSLFLGARHHFTGA